MKTSLIMLQHNQRKRIMVIRLGKSENNFRILIETSGPGMLYVETRGLTADQAKVLSEGYVSGLQWAAALPREFIDMLLSDPLELASLDVPLTVDPADRGLFKRGTIGALELAAEGYWWAAPASDGAAKPPVNAMTVSSPVC